MKTYEIAGFYQMGPALVPFSEGGLILDWQGVTLDDTVAPLPYGPYGPGGFTIGGETANISPDLIKLPDGRFLLMVEDELGLLHCEDLNSVQNINEVVEAAYNLTVHALDELRDYGVEHDPEVMGHDRWFLFRYALRVAGRPRWGRASEKKLRWG